MKNSDNIIGKRIKAAMELKEISQIELAKELAKYDKNNNVKSYKTCVNRWINGVVIPRESTLFIIAKILDVSPDYLKGGCLLPFSDGLSDEKISDDFYAGGEDLFYKYINDYIGYDFAKNMDNKSNVQIKQLCSQIQKEINAYLIVRLNGIEKQ
ncbi:MAG: helix-turn-helix domain-containing protein [Eubacterium sp.]